MKKTVLFLWLLMLSAAAAAAGEQIKYYRVDSVKTIKGEVVDIKSETSFHKSDFTVIYLKEKKSGAIYRVEVSPDWFFNMDVMIGSKIETTGSCTVENGVNLVMTRSIAFQGEIFHFRDKYGFPLWRGKRGQPNRGGQGKHRRRGKH